MTIQEKRDWIKDYCHNQLSCKNCPLHNDKHNICYSTKNENIINEHYEILFGTEEAVTTTDEARVAQLETIVEDADTVIKIKSSRKIDNITIYFKED